jgi:hypothetical protein
LEFRYKGEALKDGATVTIVAEEDFFGEMSCETNPSSDPLNGLVLKSNPAYSNSISAELEILSNTLNAAVVQWCMGGECSLMRNKTQQTKSFPPEENIQVLFDATNIRNEGALMAKLTVTLRGESKTVFIQFVNGDTDGIRTPSLTPSPSPRRGDADAVYDLSGRIIASKLSTLNSKLNKGIYIYNGKKFVK